MINNNINFAFFGTSEFAVKILETLIENNYIPSLIITAPDKPKGRKMIMTPSPIKVFTQKNNLKIIQPEKLSQALETLQRFDLFIVAAYGKIISKNILEIPEFGALNVHPSLLPKFRGSSPIQSFILSGEEKTGVTIMLMDEQVDHGSILSISNIKYQISNMNAKQMEEKLAELGGQMLVEVIPKWVNGEIKPIEQDHSQATFTKKINKEDGLVDLEKDKPELIYRKFLAFQPWPGIYCFFNKEGKNIRVIIADMEFKDGKMEIRRVKPEGKKEIKFAEFLKGNKKII